MRIRSRTIEHDIRQLNSFGDVLLDQQLKRFGSASRRADAVGLAKVSSTDRPNLAVLVNAAGKFRSLTEWNQIAFGELAAGEQFVVTWQSVMSENFRERPPAPLG